MKTEFLHYPSKRILPPPPLRIPNTLPIPLLRHLTVSQNVPVPDVSLPDILEPAVLLPVLTDVGQVGHFQVAPYRVYGINKAA